MKTKFYTDFSIGNYPKNAGRTKLVTKKPGVLPVNVAFIGDSTLDNDYWTETETPYDKKTYTVTHQTAEALNQKSQSTNYLVTNLAVDGAITKDLMRNCYLDKILPEDAGHPNRLVHQLDTLKNFNPNIVVMSVAGNNYREALQGTLRRLLTPLQLLTRNTPEEKKEAIKNAFAKVKEDLLKDYKKIIDQVIADNPKLSRVVLLSQYYPSLTQLTPYFIYTGFSHLARAMGTGQDPFTVMQDTMNELYRDVLTHISTQHPNKEFVFVDVTSSLNPLGNKHAMQIEPNEQGSVVMGRLIAEGITYSFPKNQKKPTKMALLKMDADEQITTQVVHRQDIRSFEVKKISEFIAENRYRHVGLFFDRHSSLLKRYESAYHMIVGKQFDGEYAGLFAFGLLDASLVTIMANYLMRVAINDQLHLSLRVTAGVIAAPIILTEMIVALTTMLVLALPIMGFHHLVHSPLGAENKDVGLTNGL
ncbi:MAG: SGNH/GDSL hydrolase family protein [Legionella sp.]|nr:MAG: SGNH/GDSL hydrolase family protein [Legionella sp.]